MNREVRNLGRIPHRRLYNPFIAYNYILTPAKKINPFAALGSQHKWNLNYFCLRSSQPQERQGKETKVTVFTVVAREACLARADVAAYELHAVAAVPTRVGRTGEDARRSWPGQQKVTVTNCPTLVPVHSLLILSWTHRNRLKADFFFFFFYTRITI